MLDIKLIREKKDEVEKALLKRMEKSKLNLDEIVSLDDQRKDLILKLEELQAERNINSKVKPIPEIVEKMKEVGEDIKKFEGNLKEIEKKLKEELSNLPNIPADDVAAGGKENNKVIKTFGEKPRFTFKPRDHVEIATDLDLIDYDRGVKIAGQGFGVIKAMGLF